MNISRNQLIYVIALSACLLIGSSNVMADEHDRHHGERHGEWHQNEWHDNDDWNGSGFSIQIGPGYIGGGSGFYYGTPTYYNQPVIYQQYQQCAWVAGQYDDYGNWVPAHQVCW